MKRQATDALSRLKTTGKANTPFEHDLSLLAVDVKDEESSIFVISKKSHGTDPLNAQKEKSIDAPPALEKQIVQQALGEYCMAASLSVGQLGSKFHIDQQKFFVRKSLVREFTQIVAPTFIQAKYSIPGTSSSTHETPSPVSHVP